MEEAKKVNVELVTDSKNQKTSGIRKYWLRFKLGIAITLDIIDLLIGWIPIINTSWDIVSFIVLILILKNKKLAFVTLIELPLIGLPPFSIIDMFLPLCTIVTLMDSGENNIQFRKFKI